MSRNEVECWVENDQDEFLEKSCGGEMKGAERQYGRRTMGFDDDNADFTSCLAHITCRSHHKGQFTQPSKPSTVLPMGNLEPWGNGGVIPIFLDVSPPVSSVDPGLLALNKAVLVGFFAVPLGRNAAHVDAQAATMLLGDPRMMCWTCTAAQHLTKSFRPISLGLWSMLIFCVLETKDCP